MGHSTTWDQVTIMWLHVRRATLILYFNHASYNMVFDEQMGFKDTNM